MTHDVVIIGGGPVGLGLAIDLGQRGHSVAVVERYRALHPVPKGQNLTQRTLENIDHWGCERELRAARIVPRGVANGGLVTYGTLLGEHAYNWLPRESVGTYYGQSVDRMPQYCTERVLRERVAKLPSVELFYGWRFDAMAQDAEGVAVDIVEYKGEARRSLRGRYAVGCDGSHSATRAAAGIGQEVKDHDRKMVLLVFQSPELHRLLGERYEEKSFYYALSPELEGYWKFLGRVDGDTTWFYHAPVAVEATAENTDFAAMLHEAVGQEFALDINYVGFWDLRFVLAESYRAGRVLIAGDACHSHPPYGGYGINTGFEDARNLGWKLGAVLEGWGGDGLLDSYDAERRPVFASLRDDFIERFIEEDRAFLRTYDPEDDAEAFAREWAARNVGSTEVFSYEPHYEGSPLVGGPGRPAAKGDHQFTARAGHHLAPRALSDGRTTYQALDGSAFTLFDFNGLMGEDFAGAAEAAGVPLTVIRDRYEGERCDYGTRAILVRPDGYVAWAGEAGEAAEILMRAVGRGIPDSFVRLS